MARRMRETPVDISRLATAMQRARLSLQRFRENRLNMVREYVGRNWSEEGTRRTVPVNLLALYVSVVGRALIAKAPRLMLSTFNRQAKPTVNAMQTWANQEIEETKLANTLQRIVVDALFSIGIVKVALASPADSAHVAWTLSAGQPFAERVDLDDFVYDVHARDFNEVGWIGHRYRTPRRAAVEMLGRKAKGLQSSPDRQFNEQGDERIYMLGRGYQAGDFEEYEDMVDLWEVYLPRDRVVVTLPDDYLIGAQASDSGGALLQQPWIGPDTGPYAILGFGTVPGNAMPKGPMQDLLDLHEAVNRTFRKIVRAIDRTKEVAAVQGGAQEDGGRIIHADDGDMVTVNRPEAIKQLVFGGQHAQPLMLLANAFKDLFSWQAGNLDIMGGLSPQSKTATQDRMLNENSSRAITDLQERTTEFVAHVLKKMCWYWHNDPVKVQKTSHSIPGMPNHSIQRNVHPRNAMDHLGRPHLLRRDGRFEDLGIKVDPYSLKHSTPESRMATLNQVMQQVVLPLMPILQQQGIGLDINAYLQKIALLMDMPDLVDVLTIQEPPQQGEGSPGRGVPEAPQMPNQTERTYTRQNMPGRTRQGNDLNLANALQGVNPGGAQRNGQPMGVGA